MELLDKKTLCSGRWLTLIRSRYRNNKGEEFDWESIERTKATTVLVIVPRLVPSNRYVLIKQYRHPIERYVLGFPAGLYEKGAVEDEALRELKEETGYTGTIAGQSPQLRVGSGIVDDRSIVFTADIDETLPENQNPVQQLEASEDITVILKSRNELRDYILAEYADGTEIGPGLWFFSMP